MKNLLQKISIFSLFIACPLTLSLQALALEDCPGYWVYNRVEKINYCVGGDAKKHQISKMEFMDYSEPQASQVVCSSAEITAKEEKEGLSYNVPASLTVQLVDAKGNITEVVYTADYVTQSSASSPTSR